MADGTPRRSDGGEGRERSWLRACPAIFLVFGVLIGLATPAGLTISPLFAAASMVAASVLSVRATALTGLAAVIAEGALVLGLDENNAPAQGPMQTATVATVAGLAVVFNVLLRRSGEELASARDIAEAAQLAVLPVPADRVAGLRVAARYQGAQSGASIGGDLYAVQDTPHGVRMIVGDVRGKGLDAVESVTIVLGAFREAAEQEDSLEEVASRLERAMRREAARRGPGDDGETFTTAVLAEVRPSQPFTLRLLNRGHPPPLMLYQGETRFLRPSQAALPLGMDELGQWPDQCDTFDFPEGATLLLYTDGISEARDANGVFFEPAVRLRGHHYRYPDELLDEVVRAVAEHTGGKAADDAALLAVAREDSTVPEEVTARESPAIAEDSARVDGAEP
ncbi:PP2C family protein-serine/threonine phosphatase [Streptomyces sp. NPDC005438]|uniref:PP2C family protein-serine/threonine phosphatase n=1 Tax=Streptomyces sp. NPDC005438 TaxID=3156880 RepID=UPI0033A93FD1